MYHVSNDKRSKESSITIYKALETLMQTKEYAEIKITDICEVANVGRVTFYRHYDTIDDVLQKKCDEKFDGLMVYFKEFYSYNSANEPLLKPNLRYWYINSGILELILKAGKTYLIYASFERVYSKMEQFIGQKKLVAGQACNYLTAIRRAATVSILTEWIKNKKNIAPDELTRLMLEQTKDAAFGF